MSVEGILLEDLVGVEDIISLHDAIFCVHLQRQYSASRELNAFLEKYDMDVKKITEDSELKYLQALEVCYFETSAISLSTTIYRSHRFSFTQ